jgi:hypothetical protein
MSKGWILQHEEYHGHRMFELSCLLVCEQQSCGRSNYGEVFLLGFLSLSFSALSSFQQLRDLYSICLVKCLVRR